MATKTLSIVLIITFFALACNSQSHVETGYKFPSYVGFVNDFEGVFTETQIKELNDLIAKHETETTNEIAVVTISSFEPYETLFEYSYDLANYWRIGKESKNNGIAVVFGKEIRQIRIMVGYGLEDKLKDEEAKRIIENTIIPDFKKGDYFTGIKMGLLEIIAEIE